MKHGPYRGEHELPSAMLLLKVKTRDEAIGWAERYGKILGTGEIELGKVNEPWDIGLMPAPENPPLQILLIEKADQASEAGARSGKQKADLTRLRTEMTKAGVLVRTTELQPSAKAKRLVFKNNDLRVVDGPFSESKELIGGFAVLELSGMDEAIAMCRHLRGDPRRDAGDRHPAARGGRRRRPSPLAHAVSDDTQAGLARSGRPAIRLFAAF